MQRAIIRSGIRGIPHSLLGTHHRLSLAMKSKVVLDRLSSISLGEQLYDQVRRLILSRRLKPGAKLPSTRRLCEQLGISRPTVAAALERLQAEGYVEIAPGSGVYVNELLDSVTGKEALSVERSTRPIPLSQYGQYIFQLPPTPSPNVDTKEPEIAFFPWRPGLDQFPTKEWSGILKRHAGASDLMSLDANNIDSCGHLTLRQAICGLVKRLRGIECLPEQVIIVLGLHQGIDLVARLHLQAGSTVVVGNPGNTPVLPIFKSTGADLLSCEIDDQGMRIAELTAAGNADLLYVIPHHQFPTGSSMSLSRRLELLAWANDSGALILEDDYDSEYSPGRAPTPALMSLDEHQRVIFLGTLNQLMFPSLSLAYLIVPPSMVPSYRRARSLIGNCLPAQVQVAVTEFVNTGSLERHVKRLRELYALRRQALVESLNEKFGSKVSIKGDNAGVFLVASFRTRLSTEQVVLRAAEIGVGLISTENYYLGPAPPNEFILGFGSLTQEQIVEGVGRLAQVLK
jgi:GntR family transcriptional regulator / MocR family aminotransferase